MFTQNFIKIKLTKILPVQKHNVCIHTYKWNARHEYLFKKKTLKISNFLKNAE
jgi:hypothetical protein